MRNFVLILPLVFAGFTPALVAQNQNTQVQELLKRMDTMQNQLNQRDVREKNLQNRVDQLEGQLHQQNQVSLAKIEQLQGQIATTDQPSGLANAIQTLSNQTAGVAIQQNSNTLQNAINFGGYFDTEFRDDHTKDSTEFDQHRLVLAFSGTILKNAISYVTEIEFEGGGAGASYLTDNEVVVEFAHLNFNFDRAFNIKVGALLVPFGRYNVNHDSPLRDLTDRPLVNRRLIPTTWSAAGIGVYGAWDMFGILFDYDIVLNNGLDEDFSTTAGGGFRGNRNSLRADNNDNKMVIGRLGIRPDLGFFDSVNLGLSFGFGKYDDLNEQDITMFAFDWTIKRGDFELIGEYALFDLDRSAREVALGAPSGGEGYYVQLNYHFFPESWRGTNRFFTAESTFTLVFRVGNVDTDDSADGIDRDTRGVAFRDDIMRYTVGLNFRPIEKSVLKIEYQFWTETSGIEDADNDRFVISFATYF